MWKFDLSSKWEKCCTRHWEYEFRTFVQEWSLKPDCSPWQLMRTIYTLHLDVELWSIKAVKSDLKQIFPIWSSHEEYLLHISVWWLTLDGPQSEVFQVPVITQSGLFLATSPILFAFGKYLQFWRLSINSRDPKQKANRSKIRAVLVLVQTRWSIERGQGGEKNDTRNRELTQVVEICGHWMSGRSCTS